MTDYVVLESFEALQSAVKSWRTKPVVALDTEFVRTRTFYPNLGLLQVFDGEMTFIVDPFIIDDLAPLADLMLDESVLKVLHACSEDIELIDRVLGVLPSHVWDTQIAAQFAGESNAIGLAKLVEQSLGVTLPKDQTQSDWLARPLTPQQLLYAAEDVHYLYDVYLGQRKLLDEKNLSDWVLEDTALQVASSLPPAPDDYYQRLRGGWPLKGERLWLLAQLASWREQTARQLNLPRGFVIKDPLLIAIAERPPSSPRQLSAIKGMPQAFVRKYASAVMGMVRASQTVERDHLPERIAGPLPSAGIEQMKAAKKLVAQIAEQLGLPSEVVAKRKPMEQMLRSGLFSGQYDIPKFFSGWRKERVALPLIDCFEQVRLGHLDES
ncbi:ribonuclease D [Salinibius halmophilus]|uniref:ribonuclease D n=1 Tax=Salinibius halmophilus TaxID=1853216 RepID=UPI000E660DD1|nr:ribonuclease D [Salinibius halmophilus]